jgi:hypothetical protein
MRSIAGFFKPLNVIIALACGFRSFAPVPVTLRRLFAA